MAQNAENFGTNRVVLDPDGFTDGVLTIFVKGESEPRLVIDIDGTILAGNGSVPPTAAAAPSATAISKVNGGDAAFVSTASSAGASTVQSFTTGAATAANNLHSDSGAASADVHVDASVGGTASVSVAVNSQNMIVASHDGAIPVLGFFGAGATARPHLPAAPTADDISTALVALGLVVQD